MVAGYARLGAIADGELLRPRVLVVDAAASGRSWLRRILAGHYDVLAAAGSAEALEILQRLPVDAVTLNLPAASTAQLADALRRSFPEVEVVIPPHTADVSVVAALCRALAAAIARRRAQQRLGDFLDALEQLVPLDARARSALERLHADGALRELEPGADPTLAADDGTVSWRFLELLATAVEPRCPGLRPHARRVAACAAVLAERLGMAREEREQVRVAAFLHDLGKLGVPSELLLLPAPLAASQELLVREHPEIGARLIHTLQLAGPIGIAIRHHHERWDGRGYPDGLAREQIPAAARIVAVADAYDAMTRDRPYRAARPRASALRELEACAGTQFDPDVTRAFLTLVGHATCPGASLGSPSEPGARSRKRAGRAVDATGGTAR